MRPKCSSIGKDLGLQRQKRAARIDQVNARQTVLDRDFLRAQMLLHGDRIVGAALDGRVVGDDHRLAPLDAADAGDDARARRLVVVHAPGRQRREFDERAVGIDQALDAIAHQQLAAFDVTLARIFGTALPHALDRGAQLRDLRFHHLAIALEVGTVGAHAGFNSYPCQSLLPRISGRPASMLVPRL